MRPIDFLMDALVPAACIACGRRTAATEDDLSLCRLCRDLIRPPRPHCSGCGRPLSHDVCPGCVAAPPPFRRLHFLWDYLPPVDAVLLGLKLGRLDYLGPQIARCLARELRDHLVDHDAVTSVPLHWSRHLSRGYNQAELVARPLALALDLPYARLLRRRRRSPPQRLLTRARRLRGLGGLFVPLARGDVGGCRVLLVDDVITTGATLAAAARACLGGGAVSVTALAVARTPLPGERAGPSIRGSRPGEWLWGGSGL